MEKKVFNKKFGRFVAEIRIRKGLTQIDLAALIGNNPQNISRLERGEVSPTLYWITLLADALEINFSELIKEFENSTQNKTRR